MVKMGEYIPGIVSSLEEERLSGFLIEGELPPFKLYKQGGLLYPSARLLNH
jgi:hypothetical protein